MTKCQTKKWQNFVVFCLCILVLCLTRLCSWIRTEKEADNHISRPDKYFVMHQNFANRPVTLIHWKNWMKSNELCHQFKLFIVDVYEIQCTWTKCHHRLKLQIWFVSYFCLNGFHSMLFVKWLKFWHNVHCLYFLYLYLSSVSPNLKL